MDNVEICDIGNGVKLQIGANLGAVISALRNRTYIRMLNALLVVRQLYYLA